MRNPSKRRRRRRARCCLLLRAVAIVMHASPSISRRCLRCAICRPLCRAVILVLFLLVAAINPLFACLPPCRDWLIVATFLPNNFFTGDHSTSFSKCPSRYLSRAVGCATINKTPPLSFKLKMYQIPFLRHCRCRARISFHAPLSSACTLFTSSCHCYGALPTRGAVTIHHKRVHGVAVL